MQDKRICKFGGRGVDIMLEHDGDNTSVYQIEGYNFVIVSSEIGSFITRQGTRIDLVCVEDDGAIRWTVTQVDIPHRPAATVPLTCRQQSILAACKYFKIVWKPYPGSVDNPFILPFDELAWREVGPPDDRRCRLVATAKAADQDAHFHVNAYSADASNSRIADLVFHLDNSGEWETVEIAGRQYVILIRPFCR